MDNRGFTLIEIIAALVLGGIILAMAGMGIVKVTEGLVFTQKNASTTLKAQVALIRIEKEFIIITGVSSGTSTSLAYTSNKGGVAGPRTLNFSAGAILIDGDTLVDNVASFSLGYRNSYSSASATTWDAAKKIIEVTFALTGAGGVNSTFTMRVAPRML